MEIKVDTFEPPNISNIITLYHGSTSTFDNIDVACGKPYKDFGRGFYTSKKRSNAERLVRRNQIIESKRKKVNVSAYLYAFTLDLDRLNELNIKEFKEADKEWIQFVLQNRKSKYKTHDFDIVMGPTADDDTLLVIYSIKLRSGK